jgi:hypothetical protein
VTTVSEYRWVTRPAWDDAHALHSVRDGYTWACWEQIAARNLTLQQPDVDDMRLNVDQVKPRCPECIERVLAVMHAEQLAEAAERGRQLAEGLEAIGRMARRADEALRQRSVAWTEWSAALCDIDLGDGLRAERRTADRPEG